MKRAKYRCINCNKITEQLFKVSEKIPLKITCECGMPSTREFNISIEKESDTISHAINTMLYSKLPSGKSQSII